MDALALRLLGPVQLHVDGSPVPLGGPRRRALLAYLAMHREVPLSSDRLIDALWGDRAGPGTPHALQTHVCALRRALRHPVVSDHSGAPDPITHGASGYRLDTDRLTIDVEVFERAAGQAVDRGDPVAASRALELWTGEPLADLPPQPWAEAILRDLQQRRREVALVHIDAELRAGHHVRVLPLVEHLLSTHPYDERLWACRLLALYRAGRQTEALAAYERFRRSLRDDLGVEPGPELAGLQRGILLHDPRLARPDAPPHRVPASISSFVGRRSELGHLRQLVRDHRLVTVTGPGGVGKTRTAIELAHTLRDRAPDGVFFVDLGEVHDAERVPAQIADRLDGYAGADALEHLVELLVGRDTLLVLDNAEHLRIAVASTVVALLRHSQSLRILVTSRVALGVTGEVVWRLPPLDLPRADDTPERLADRDAVRLFVDRLADVRPRAGVDERDRRVIAAICHLVDGLPLAIELAASRSRAGSLTELSARLQHDLGGLRSTDPTVPERHRTLAAVLRWSTDLLDPVGREVFADLAVVPGDFDRALATAVCRCGAAEGTSADSANRHVEPGTRPPAIDESPAIDEPLATLVDHSLLAVDTDGDRVRYRMLQVVRDHAMSLLEDEGGRARAELALLDWAQELTRVATRGLTGPDEPGWVERLATVRAALRAALAAGLRHDPALGLRLATRLARFWWANAGDTRNPQADDLPTLHEGIRWLRRLLAAYDGDARGRAGGEIALGFLLDVTGAHLEARELLTQVRDRLELTGEVRLAGWAALYAANASWRHEPDEVIASYGLAGDRLASVGDRWGAILAALIEYSFTLDRVGRERAQPALERFLAMTAGPLPATLGAYRAAVLATDALARGRPDEAYPSVLTALERARRVTDPVTSSLLLALCAWYAAQLGDVTSSARWLAAAELSERRYGLDVPAAAAGRRRAEHTLGPALTPVVRATAHEHAAGVPIVTIIDQVRSALDDDLHTGTTNGLVADRARTERSVVRSYPGCSLTLVSLRPRS